MKLMYKPFGLIAALIAARLGKTLFTALWARIDEEDPPDPTTADTTFPKVILAKTLEAATLAAVAAVIDRAGAKLFEHLTGFWPGDEEPGE